MKPYYQKARTIALSAIILVIAMTAIPTESVKAQYSRENLPDKTVYNDFVVGPGKVQLDMRPGETKVVNLTVTNRLGTEKDFQIEMEDLVGSRDPNRTVVLLGQDRGPHSLKDFLAIASTTFKIGHAVRTTVPVLIHVPADAEAGGLYGSVVISTVSNKQNVDAQGNSMGTSPIITRIGTLFFIRVAGDVVEDGKVTEFTAKNGKIQWSNKPITFRILYENNGTVHVNPYGLITVSNMLGAPVTSIQIEPWFSLPDSLRLREVNWNHSFLFGRYVATAEINRGYGDVIDTETFTFWVIPWKIIAGVFGGLIVVILLLKWVFSKFTIVTKR